MSLSHDNEVPLVAKGDKFVSVLPGDAGGVEEAVILAHVEWEGLHKVGSIPRQGTGYKPVNMVVCACMLSSGIQQ